MSSHEREQTINSKRIELYAAEQLSYFYAESKLTIKRAYPLWIRPHWALGLPADQSHSYAREGMHEFLFSSFYDFCFRVCESVFITGEGESQNKGNRIWSYEERR